MKHFKIPFIIVATFLFVIVACKKNNNEESLDGKYNGFFIRTTSAPNVDPARATVELNFTGNDFSGSSNLRNYPAICNGSYTAKNGELKVTNGCPFTADFEWTYIFDGQYKYSRNGNELTIWRDYADGRSDVYTLQKQ